MVRIEKRLNALETLGKELQSSIEELSTEIMNAGHGEETKLDRILQLLETKK